MPNTLRRVLLLALVATQCAFAAPLDRGALIGTYSFVQLEVSTAGATVTRARSAFGRVEFDGAGRFAFLAEVAEGAGPFTAISGGGGYTVDAVGNVRLKNPLAESLELRARIGAGSTVLLGTTSAAPAELKDFFVAVRAGEGISERTLDGEYGAASMGFPGSNPGQFYSSLVTFSSLGTGRFSTVSLIGHTAGGKNERQSVAGATYQIGPDGTGIASFGNGAPLLQGDYRIFATTDGAFLIGLSTGAKRDILIAVRRHPGRADSFSGRYWIGELSFAEGIFSSASGSIIPDGRAGVLVSERLHFTNAAFDFSGLNFFGITDENGGGWLANRVLDHPLENMALGVTSPAGAAAAVVGAQVGISGQETPEFGLFFAVRAPEFDSGETILHPAGVVNGASFAPAPNPIAPGSIVSLFGDGFTAQGNSAAAESLPLPEELQGLRVLINDRPAPFFFISERQANIQVPFELEGSLAAIRLSRGASVIASVEVPLSPTSPGVFFYSSGQSAFRGIVTHLDGSLVTEANPAAPGEVVVIYATGLGALTPPAATGAGSSLSSVAQTVEAIEVFVNRTPAEVLFAGGAPGFAGLYQINARIALDTPAPGLAALAVGTPHAFHDQADIPLRARASAKLATAAAVGVSATIVPPRARR